jgi:hypothetical protein
LPFADDNTHHPLPLLPLRRGVVFMAAKELCSSFRFTVFEPLQRCFAPLSMTWAIQKCPNH